MSAIQAVQRKVFYAPTANRHFFSKRAAAKREVSAMMDNKYPTEYPEINWYTGQQITAGGHWSEDDRLRRVHDRLSRIIMRRLK